MSVAEVRAKSDQEIVADIHKYRREILNLNFQRAAGEIVNLSRFRVVRKMIARCKTVIAERKAIAGAPQVSKKKSMRGEK